MDAPQIIVIVLMAVGIAVTAINHGKPNTYNVYRSIVRNAVLAGLLLWGGFFG
jgi:hypothetical protein